MLIDILAILSAAAAAGMRIALPLLVIGLLQSEELWTKIPLLSRIHPPVLIGVLISWSCFELFASKKLLGQRILQISKLIFSPIAGGIMAMGVAKITGLFIVPLWLIGLLGGTLALVINLVLMGWFFRLGGMPIAWVIFEDVLCIVLVLSAFNSPKEGGLIALLLLWLAIRSSKEWYNWYLQKKKDFKN